MDSRGDQRPWSSWNQRKSAFLGERMCVDLDRMLWISCRQRRAFRRSTRFAAADSYAALTSTIAEVGYSGSPATSSTMDMVYRIQIAGTQITGAYQDNLMYVVAPSF